MVKKLIPFNRKHLFATAKRSLRSKQETADVYLKLIVAFPKHEGYDLRITKWENVGEYVDVL